MPGLLLRPVDPRGPAVLPLTRQPVEGKGRPDIEEYARGYEDDSVPGHERIDLSGLSAHLRLEVQYALQGRHDDGAIKIAPSGRPDGSHVPAASAPPSLLDRTRTPGVRRGSSGSPEGSPPGTGTPAGRC